LHLISRLRTLEGRWKDGLASTFDTATFVVVYFEVYSSDQFVAKRLACGSNRMLPPRRGEDVAAAGPNKHSYATPKENHQRIIRRSGCRQESRSSNS
jgi:hypothetical protein